MVPDRTGGTQEAIEARIAAELEVAQRLQGTREAARRLSLAAEIKNLRHLPELLGKVVTAIENAHWRAEQHLLAARKEAARGAERS